MTVFLPGHRLERIELDESGGVVEGMADRFRRLTGRDPLEILLGRGKQRPLRATDVAAGGKRSYDPARFFVRYATWAARAWRSASSRRVGAVRPSQRRTWSTMRAGFWGSSAPEARSTSWRWTDPGLQLAERGRPIHGVRGLGQLVLPFAQAGDDHGHRLGEVEDREARVGGHRDPGVAEPELLAREPAALGAEDHRQPGAGRAPRAAPWPGAASAPAAAPGSGARWWPAPDRRRRPPRAASPRSSPGTTSCPPIAMRRRSSSSSTGNAGCTSTSSGTPKFPATRIADPTFPGYRDRTSTIRIGTEGL